MANSYLADDTETPILRSIFGPDVRTVCFWDTESGRGHFASVEGFDANERSVGTITTRNRAKMTELRTIASWRGETVKFWLDVPAPDQDDEVDDSTAG